MTKYHVGFTGWASFGVTVEAEDEDDAVDKAYDYAPQVCALCSGYGKPWYLEISDDWEPDGVEVDE